MWRPACGAATGLRAYNLIKKKKITVQLLSEPDDPCCYNSRLKGHRLPKNYRTTAANSLRHVIHINFEGMSV